MITLLSTPRKYQPAYGNLVIQFESTNQNTQFKFRYVVDIYADNEFITRLKITPQNEDWGQTDISDIIRNYVNSRPINIGCNDYTPINQCGWGYLEKDIVGYKVFVGEEYATTANGDTLIYNGNGSIGDPAVSWDKLDNKYVFNGVKEWFDGKEYDMSPFYLNTFTPTGIEPQDTQRFLTNAPRIQYIRDGEHATLAALNPRGNDQYPVQDGQSFLSEPVFSARFEFYNQNNILMVSGRTYNVESNCGWRPNCSGTTSSFPLEGNYADSYISYLGTGPANLLEHDFGVPSDAKYYRVCLEKSADTIPDVTPTPTPTPSSSPSVDPICDCGIYDIYNLNEDQCFYNYEPCPGGELQSQPIAGNSVARVESCSPPTQGFCSGSLTIEYVGRCVCESPSPTPTPTPSTTPGSGATTFVITVNRCSESEEVVHFVLTSPSTPSIGEFFCYNGEVYEIVTTGGGGFISHTVSTFYPDYSSAFAVCPCSPTTGDTTNCQDSVQISEWFYYYFDGECSPNSKRLMFQNKLGTFDYYTFRALDDIGYDVNRQTFIETSELSINGWNSNSYEGWLDNTKVWNNRQSKTGILRSGFIPKSDAIWLAEELLRSPRVYLIDDYGDLEPIILTNNEVIQPNPDRPGLMDIVVEYQGGYKEIRQNN